MSQILQVKQVIPLVLVHNPVSVSVGDLNNDGQFDDVVVANSGNDDIELLLHYNNGIFINTIIFSTGLRFTSTKCHCC